jgi:hypothetical protein
LELFKGKDKDRNLMLDLLTELKAGKSDEAKPDDKSVPLTPVK